MTLWFTTYPKTVVVLTLLVTLFFGYFAKDVQRDHSNENMLPADEPIRAYYDEFQKHFDIRDKIAIGLSFEGGVYTPAAMAQIDRYSRFLEGRSDIDEVTSLTTVENIEGEAGGIVAGPLVEELPETAEEAVAVAAAVRSNHMIDGVLVSKDEKATLIVAQAEVPYLRDRSGGRRLRRDPGDDRCRCRPRKAVRRRLPDGHRSDRSLHGPRQPGHGAADHLDGRAASAVLVSQPAGDLDSAARWWWRRRSGRSARCRFWASRSPSCRRASRSF